MSPQRIGGVRVLRATTSLASPVYQYSGLVVWVRGERVDHINVSGPDYKTQEGIGVGSTELEVRAKLGRPERVDEHRDSSGRKYETYYVYGKLSVELNLDTNGTVTLLNTNVNRC